MIPAKRPTNGTTRSVAGRSRRKRAVIALPALLLATAFTLAATPSATAAPAFANGSVATFSDPCRGQKPGVCPNYSIDQPNQQSPQSPYQSTTHQSSAP